MHGNGESSGEAFDGGQPDFLFSPGFDLLKEVLGKVGDFGQFLLRQAMLKA